MKSAPTFLRYALLFLVAAGISAWAWRSFGPASKPATEGLLELRKLIWRQYAGKLIGHALAHLLHALTRIIESAPAAGKATAALSTLAHFRYRSLHVPERRLDCLTLLTIEIQLGCQLRKPVVHAIAKPTSLGGFDARRVEAQRAVIDA